jgi:glycosyltransferase involved in cell wall biosynthesis
MRILRIHSWDGQPGGGEEVIRTVSLRLEAAGHPQCIVELVDRPPAAPTPLERPFMVPSGGWGRIRTDLWSERRLLDFLRDAYREFHPDLVHLHHYDAGFASIARALAEFPAPLVFTAHDAELVCPISTLVKPGNVVCEGGVRLRCLTTGCEVGWGGPFNILQRRSFDRHVAPRVRAYLAPSRSIQGYLERNGYAPAVRLPSFAEIPESVRIAPPQPPADDRPPTVGFLGRLERTKGVQVLLPALAALAREYPTIRLEVGGDGPFRPELERQAHELGVSDRVAWRGAVRGPEKEAFFAGIHVLAFPSIVFENFGLVALEALARGRPVVASDIGGIPDLVEDGRTGRLVPIGDAPALARALGELLREPARAAELAGEGRRRVLREFTPEVHLERLLAVYEAVREGRPIARGSTATALLAPGGGGAAGPAQWVPVPATPFPVNQK